MPTTQDTLKSMVSVTQFNKGQASKIFDRLHKEKQLIVLKNNKPSAVILSPEEYIRLSDIADEYALMIEAQERLQKSTETLSFEETMKSCNITQEELDNIEEPEIE